MIRKKKINSVEQFQILLCTTYNSIKRQLYGYTHLNDQTVLFQTIQLGFSHFFALSLNI